MAGVKKRPRNLIVKIWDEIVLGGYFVALGDFSAMVAFAVILGLKVPVSFFVVVFLSILAINFFNRYKEKEIDLATNKERSLVLRKYHDYIPYVVVAIFVVSLLLTFFYAPIYALVFMLFLFALGLFYSLYLKDITKNIIGFKNIMTALPYALLIVFMLLYSGASFTLSAGLLIIFYFIRMFINTAFFDIKDISADKQERLKTLPIIFGESNTIKILIFLNFLSLIPVVYGIYAGVLPAYSIGLAITVLYASLFLRINKPKITQSNFYNGLVDGEFILWLPYVIVGGSLL